MNDKKHNCRKRACILTLPIGANLGGVLQAYALSATVRNLGYDVDVEVIKRNKKLAELAKQFFRSYMYRLIKPLYHNIRRYPTHAEINTIYSGTKDFISRNITVTGKIDNNSAKKYNALIVGSDQVWRLEYTDDINHYFLDFARNINIRRIAYAASFGTSQWTLTESQTKQCSELAKNFDAVSVREFDALSICKRYLNVEAQLTLDPTMLIGAIEWETLIGNNKCQDMADDSIIAYVLDNDTAKAQAISHISTKTSLKAHIISQKREDPYYYHYEEYGTEGYKVPNVEHFIDCYSRCRYVITDSFHGTVFAILFNKPFITIANKNRGNSRFDTLLGIFGLKDRIVGNPAEITVDKMLQPIDWKDVNSKLAEYRESSLAFLKSSLS